MRSRLRKFENSGGVSAAVVLLLALAFCFGMYWWQLRYEYALRDPVANLYLVHPFRGAAVMVATGMGRTAAAISWLVLAGLTGVAYVEAAISSSSTAAVAFVAPFVWGGLLVSTIFVVDYTIRRRRRKRVRHVPPSGS